MKKKVIALLLTAVMGSSLLAGCGSGSGTAASSTADSTSGAAAASSDAGAGASAGASTGSSTVAAGSKGVINLWAFTDEVPKMVDKFIEAHPDFGYTVNPTIIATTDGAYQPALDAALQAGGEEQPDIYCAEAAFILKYSKGNVI